MVSANAVRTPNQTFEGVAVVGEAVRRVPPESAEFLVEIAATGQTVAQSVSHHQNLVSQLAQAVSGQGVNRADLQVVSMNVANVYTPALAPPAFPTFATQAALQPDLQFGAYHASSTVRVMVRDSSRAAEVADVLVKAGAQLVGGLSYGAGDESAARKTALEAAVKDARSKAETLAVAAGKQLGDPLAINEEVIASNGVYTAMRAQVPWAFGPQTPTAAGELEYYARVTASFRFQ